MEETSQADLLAAMEELLSQPVRMTRFEGRDSGEWWMLYWQAIGCPAFGSGIVLQTRSFDRYMQVFNEIRDLRKQQRNCLYPRLVRKPIASERERGKPASRIEGRGERRRIHA